MITSRNNFQVPLVKTCAVPCSVSLQKIRNTVFLFVIAEIIVPIENIKRWFASFYIFNWYREGQEIIGK